MKFKSEADRNTHPAVRLIPEVLFHHPQIFNDCISDTEISLFTKDLSSVTSPIQDDKSELDSSPLRQWLCILLGHPSASVLALYNVADNLGISQRDFIKGAMLTNNEQLLDTSFLYVRMLEPDEAHFTIRLLAELGYIPVMEKMLLLLPEIKAQLLEYKDYQVFHNGKNEKLLNYFWFKAAEQNNIKLLSKLLPFMLMRNINICNAAGVSAIEILAAQGSVQGVQLLIVTQAIKLHQLKRAFINAVQHGHTELTSFLLSRGVNPNFTDDDNVSLLMLAAANDHVEIIKLLIEFSARIDFKDKQGRTAFNRAKPSSKAAALLQDYEKKEAFFKAVKSNNIVEIQKLLCEGLSIETRDEEGDTPLLKAALYGNAQTIKFLLTHNADISATDNYEWNVLMKAAVNGHVKYLKLLLSEGNKPINIDAHDTHGRTALIMAIDAGNIPVVNFLIKKGANIHLKDVNGMTPLTTAVMHNHFEMIHLLIKAGELSSLELDTALKLAIAQNNIKIVKLLLDNGAYKNILNKNEILQLASHSNIDILNLLENFGSFQYRLEKIKYLGPIDHDLKCPISYELMNDPVTTPTGQTFDRTSLKMLFATDPHPKCPLTREVIGRDVLGFGTTIIVKKAIERFVAEKEQQAKNQKHTSRAFGFFGGSIFEELETTFMNEANATIK